MADKNSIDKHDDYLSSNKSYSDLHNDLDVRDLGGGPYTRESDPNAGSRRGLSYLLLAAVILHPIAAFYAALFAPDRLDGVLKVMNLTFGTSCTLLGASLAFYFRTGAAGK